jgi:hypothetical protein
MEPMNNAQPNFELPRPQQPESQGASAPEQTPVGPTPEKMPGAGEHPGAAMQPVMQPPAPLVPATQVPSQAPPVKPAHPVGTSVPAIASDADLIEKEWVEIAKQIVEKTRSDPHVQNKEINKFKADYMKKRYDKDIKVTND